MKKRWGLIVILLFAAIFSGGVQQQAEKKPEYVPGEVLVKFKPTVAAASVNRVMADLQAKMVKQFAVIGVRQWKLGEGMAVEQAVARLKSDPNVAYAEPNYIYHIDVVPNDARFSELWGLNNTGQTGGTNDADIDAPEAWDIATGSDTVLIAVIDTGVDYKHPDLATNLWTNPGEDPWQDPNNPATGNKKDDDGNGKVDDWRGWDFVNNDNDPFDDNQHGTHVAGTIGAIGNNGVGVVGVNWTVKIMPLKFLSAEGSGSTSDAIEAILYAVAKKARVMNNSWGGGGYSQALRDAIAVADQANALFVAAAGNEGTDNDQVPNYPSNYDVPNVVAVAATDHRDNLAVWNGNGGGGGCPGLCASALAAGGSNYGATTVDLGAPGKNILSTTPNAGYASFQGTSMATPHVSGAAGLVLSRFPLTNHQLKDRLLATVDGLSSLQGKCVTGGRLNVHRALSAPLALGSDASKARSD